MGQRFSSRVGLLATAAIMLAGLAAGPASAAPGCSGVSCVTYYADLTITVSTSPLPVFPGDVHYYTVRVTNTGTNTPVPAGTHPSNVPAAFAQDVYRMTVKVTGQGWNADVANALIAVPVGASANVPVYAWKSAGATANATVTVTIASESDSTKTASVTATIR